MAEEDGAAAVSGEDVTAGALPEQSTPLDERQVPPRDAGSTLATPGGATYEIVRVLESRAQSRRYEARRASDGVLTWLTEAYDADSAARLTQEAEILRHIDSPMYLRLLEFGETDGRTVLAVEASEGEHRTLDDVLRDAGHAFTSVVSTLAQTAFALARLHEIGWLHLGLSPQGIQVNKPVRILDLSRATRIGERPAERFFLPGYSPPELLEETPPDARADVYAIGALLSHAANGHPIEETGLALSGLEKQITMPGVPQILHRCLGSSDSRYGRMEDLHHDLVRLAHRLAPGVRHVVAAATTIGLEPTRMVNQDSYVYLGGAILSEAHEQTWTVACVADGMGGMQAGEVASNAAVRAVQAQARAAFAETNAIAAQAQAQWLPRWAIEANVRVCAALQARHAHGGSTFLCVCVVDERLTIAHVGDCRLYLIRGDSIQRLTNDHSLVMALALLGQGSIDDVRRHPDRSRVTRSLGGHLPLPAHEVDTLEQVTGQVTFELQAEDTLLLCSDGLWEPVLEDEMVHVVRDSGRDLDKAASRLIDAAVQRGAPDNATALLVRVVARGGLAGTG